MKQFLAILVLLAMPALTLAQGNRTTLDIYYVDVEGGASTLIVTPAGESILVDAGWPGFDGRDATRIEKALKQAGLTQIDHLIMTHYHVDHFGGIPELAKRVKVINFYDHGPMTELTEDKDFAPKYAAYRAAAKDKTITLKPGDSIKLKRAAGLPPVTLQVLAAAREIVAEKGMAGAKNPACATATTQAEDPSDNARSVAFLLRYGAFDFFDGGDLTWNIEHKLACPANLIGEVDLYQVTHHGLDTSNNTALLASVKPTVAIMNNGPRKGGSATTIKALRELPSLKALYQGHRNITLTAEQNVAEEFIANVDDKNDAANMITVSVDAGKKSFAVTNGRTGKSQTFPVK
ncbi:MAG: MBL fold metallo-hydrolase [Acidobacteria bacterium]|nr:MBL fold metallo-hydrolase [Acidobacteriota bacterium]MBI3423787.1 MBL fold metallo-hydrolase [Acidobacteriota bacterium]